MRVIYSIIEKFGITPNQLYVLDCIYNSIQPPGWNNLKQEVRFLVLKELYDIENSKITEKGMNLINEVNAFVKQKKTKPKTQVLTEEHKQFLIDYRNIFPNMILSHGHSAKATPKEIRVRFDWFFSEFDYTRDEILKATQMYVQQKENDNWKFCKTASNFIKKTENGSIVSTLASFCDFLRSGGDSEIVKFEERVF